MAKTRKKTIKGSPEELRFRAQKCAAKAYQWLKKSMDFEKAARREEKTRDKKEKIMWPEEHCKACVLARTAGGKPCLLHMVD